MYQLLRFVKITSPNKFGQFLAISSNTLSPSFFWPRVPPSTCWLPWWHPTEPYDSSQFSSVSFLPVSLTIIWRSLLSFYHFLLLSTVNEVLISVFLSSDKSSLAWFIICQCWGADTMSLQLPTLSFLFTLLLRIKLSLVSLLKIK